MIHIKPGKIVRLLVPLVVVTALLTSRENQGFQGSIHVPKNNKSQHHKLAKISMERAVEIASASIPGTPIEAELEAEDGFLVYEIELSTGAHAKTEVTIDAGNGNILKQEREDEEQEDSDDDGDDDGDVDDGDDDGDVDANYGKPQTSLQNAIKIALATSPGTPVEAELEKKTDHFQYEIEIIDANGKTSKVRINADTGKVE